MIGTIAKAAAAFASGGWYALIGAAGAAVGEAAANVWKPVLDYVWLDDENKCLKDHPEWRECSIPKRIWRTMV